MTKSQNFNDYPLEDELKKSLERLKFTEPKLIQSKVMEDSLKGLDIMARAETGSGKTLAYCLPVLNKLLLDPNKTALILAPTRELVHQISEVLRDITASIEGFRITSLVGGSDMGKQVRALKRKPRVVAATPGRLNDHLRRGTLKLKNLQSLVIDEGDRMLDMGFMPQLEEICSFLPEKRQSLLFTATLPKKVKELAKAFLNDPKVIEIGGDALPVASIRQSVIELSQKQKLDRTVDELNAREGSIVIFARTKSRVDDVARSLKSFGFKVESIHGDKTQGQRNRVIKKFKAGESRILVATDIAARGLDVPSVGHVINYDLPRMKEDYVHRVGRTARNGADGEAVSYVTPSDYKEWMVLIKTYQIKGCELKTTKGEFSGKSGSRSGYRSRSGGGSGGGARSGGYRGRSGDGRDGGRSDSRRGSEDRPSRGGSGKSYGGESRKKYGQGSGGRRSEAQGEYRSDSSKSSSRYKSDKDSNGGGSSYKKKSSYKKSSSDGSSSFKKSSSKKTAAYKKPSSKKSSFKKSSSKSGDARKSSGGGSHRSGRKNASGGSGAKSFR